MWAVAIEVHVAWSLCVFAGHLDERSPAKSLKQLSQKALVGRRIEV